MENSNDYVCIRIEKLALMLRVGLLPRERAAAQRVLVSLDLYASPDYLDGVNEPSIIDYGDICARLQAWEAGEHVDLVETLAERAIAIGLSYDAAVAVRARIEKPDIVPAAKSVGIEIFRSRA